MRNSRRIRPSFRIAYLHFFFSLMTTPACEHAKSYRRKDSETPRLGRRRRSAADDQWLTRGDRECGEFCTIRRGQRSAGHAAEASVANDQIVVGEIECRAGGDRQSRADHAGGGVAAGFLTDCGSRRGREHLECAIANREPIGANAIHRESAATELVQSL